MVMDKLLSTHIPLSTPSRNPRRLVLLIVAALLGALLIWATMTVAHDPCVAPSATWPSGCTDWPSSVLSLSVGATYWSVGLLAWWMHQPAQASWFFWVMGGLLATERLANGGDPTALLLMFGLTIGLVPLLVDFLFSLIVGPPNRIVRWTIYLLYGYALLLGLGSAWAVAVDQIIPVLWFAAALYVLSAVVIIATILWFDHHTSRPTDGSPLRLMAFSILLAFIPAFLLTMLPHLLASLFYLTFDITALNLLLIPLVYSYLLARNRLPWVAHLRQIAALYILGLLLLAAYIMLYTLLATSTDLDLTSPFLSVTFAILLLLALLPLREQTNRFLNWVWYGSAMSYSTVIGTLADALAGTLDRERLRHLLVHEVPMALVLQPGLALLREYDALVERPPAGDESRTITLPLSSPLVMAFQQGQPPLRTVQLRALMAKQPLSVDEQALLERPEIALWLPLWADSKLQGLVLVGERIERGYFTGDDHKTLATLAHQAAIAAHNVQLAENIAAGRRELAHAHGQLLAARERDQLKIAHALHDDAVQSLIAVGYRLAELDRQLTTGEAMNRIQATTHAARQEVVAVLHTLRATIGELRPPGLDLLGLTAALESFVARLRRERGNQSPRLILDLEPIGASISEIVAICLFRVVQEGVRNALKHANAQTITICLRYSAGIFKLSVVDDGIGFSVPLRLSELVRGGHYGLIGLAERVEWLGGQWHLESEPDVGTSLIVVIPWNQHEEKES
jgi:signal transduction histidine kinase